MTGISGIGNGIGIPLPMGVPEIRIKNWNSQPSTSTWNFTLTNPAQNIRIFAFFGGGGLGRI